jgi:3-hydroxyacyl-[acyl-carrier-protein] dehydratase
MTTLPLHVPADHPSYAGHFPGQPILAGVVLLDLSIRALQAACGCAVTGVAQAKFLSPVQPGELLLLDYEAGAASITFAVRSGERKVASGRFSVRENTAA